MAFQRLFIILVLLIITTPSIALTSPLSPKIKCVVIDAGHGGTDPGAIGFYKTKEKDVTLSIALKIGKLISENFPEVKVVYTRKTDVFVELFKRADIANKNKADLFISIHCNAAPKKVAFGTEVFVMGNHKSAANLEVAKKENASILLEDDYIDRYNGFNPNSAEAYIIFSLFQNVYLNNSLTLATNVQNQMVNTINFYDRGVKQAGFLVLYKTSMPGILIETGFISNPNDEVFLKSDEGQTSIAKAIVNAFAKYKHTIEGGSEKSFKPIYTKITKYNEVKNPHDTINVIKKKVDTINIKTDELTTIFLKNNNTNNINNNNNVDSVASYLPKCNSDSGIVFKVQFASSNVDKPINSDEFSKVPYVEKYIQDGVFKYTSGCEINMNGANSHLKYIRNLGYKDAFIVAFKDKIRISTSEAIKLLNSSN